MVSSYFGGHADTSANKVSQFLRPVLGHNFKLMVRELPAATGSLVAGALSFVHIDVDVYESGKLILDWCTPRISTNGVIIFDDF